MKIRMYSADWCSDCRMAKKYLDENAIEYDLVDVTEHPEAGEYVKSVNGGKRIIPTFVIEDKVYTNPGIPELIKIINQ